MKDGKVLYLVYSLFTGVFVYNLTVISHFLQKPVHQLRVLPIKQRPLGLTWL